MSAGLLAELACAPDGPGRYRLALSDAWDFLLPSGGVLAAASIRAATSSMRRTNACSSALALRKSLRTSAGEALSSSPTTSLIRSPSGPPAPPSAAPVSFRWTSRKSSVKAPSFTHTRCLGKKRSAATSSGSTAPFWF